MQGEPDTVAAGVLLWRGSAAAPRFLLLRNARHGTWGFAKGHLEPGEDLLGGALRETREETGLRLAAADLVPGFADASHYRTPAGALKRVVLFLAAAPAPETGFLRSSEHDAHDWPDHAAALALLKHEEAKRALIRAAVQLARPLR
jgi:8-oxo-dGTP pyrophosphatase MutT (NUDIX family)